MNLVKKILHKLGIMGHRSTIVGYTVRPSLDVCGLYEVWECQDCGKQRIGSTVSEGFDCSKCLYRPALCEPDKYDSLPYQRNLIPVKEKTNHGRARVFH